MLVGGGELHERYESLVRVERPLSRGIERFTGITQSMLDAAPAPEDVLPALARMLEGRVLVAHSASFDRRVLRQAFERAGDRLERAAVHLHGRPRAALRAAREQAGASAARRGAGDRAGGRPSRARRRGDLRARLLRPAPEALRERRDTRRGGRAARATPPRCRRARAGGGRRASVRTFARCPTTRASTCSATLADARSTSASPCRVRSRARAHFTAPAGWTERAEVVDYKPTNSELGALVLENRLIKRWRPPGNMRLKRADGYVYLRARLDIAYPVLEVAAQPARRARDQRRAGAREGRRRGELADELSSLFGLRHCGRCARAAATHPPPTVRWGAACRRASATSTRTSTAGASTRRSRISTARTAARAWSSGWSARWPRPPPVAATSAPRSCCVAASGSAVCCCGSGGWSRPSTRARGWSWRGTPRSPAGTPSGSSAAGSPNGGRCPRPRELAGAHARGACDPAIGERRGPGRGRRDPHRPPLAGIACRARAGARRDPSERRRAAAVRARRGYLRGGRARIEVNSIKEDEWD